MTPTNHPAPESEREAIARTIYEIKPHYEGGEYVDGFQVSPGGNLSWEQAVTRDAEFGDDPLFGKITEFAYRCADAIFSRMGAEPVALREAYERLNMAEDLLGDALNYLDAPSHYAGPEGIMKEIEDYFEFKMSGRSALTASPPAPALDARTVEALKNAMTLMEADDKIDAFNGTSSIARTRVLEQCRSALATRAYRGK